MSAEGHFCWESCDEGPHGCVCGNDCSPSVRDYTPTTEEVQSYYVSGRAQIRRQITGVRAQDITPFSHEFDRWLAAHDAEKRAEWEAERRAGDEATRRQIDGLASDYYEAIIRAERAEQGDKPAPCVMTHTPPFDFAQCETHDETFPLGGACKWHGKESIYEVLEDETDEQRMRAVRAEHQLEILRAEQGETEWEYGHDCDESRATHHKNPSPQNPWQSMGTCTSATDYRRRKAGPWLPVPDTTNNESEGKA